MSIIGFYYVTKLLNAAGWPRRRSVFNSEAVFNTLMVDLVIAQMIDWSAAIGACFPKKGLKMLAYIHKNQDLETENAAWSLLKLANEYKGKKWNFQTEKEPSKIVNPPRLSEDFGELMTVKQLKEITLSLEILCQEGIIWGLVNVDFYKSWYESFRKDQIEKLPEMQKAGLNINTLPTLSDFLKECEGNLDNYEKEIVPLPEIPSKLLEDARSLGVEIDDLK